MTTNDGLSRAEIKLGFGRLLDEISDEVFNEIVAIAKDLVAESPPLRAPDPEPTTWPVRDAALHAAIGLMVGQILHRKVLTDRVS